MNKVTLARLQAQGAFAVLLATLLAIACALPAQALAAQGSITIASKDNESLAYDAYCVFLADMDGDDTATHLSWANDETMRAVLGYCNEQGYEAWLDEAHGGQTNHDTPQVAAEYLSQQIGSPSTSSEGQQSTPGDPSALFATGLARTLAASDVEAQGQARAGEEFVAEQGLWLFVSHVTDIAEEDGSGTAPIWAALGGSRDQAVEKTSVPTMEKEVRDDASEIWSKTADAQRNQPLSFRLTGTLPSNFDSFEQYHYRFEDELSEGLELVVAPQAKLEDAVTVCIDDKPVAPDDKNLLLSYDNGLLSVDFANLKDAFWADCALGSGSVITVAYQARLGERALCGMPGNPNDASLVYSSDPISEVESRTKATRANTFTYALELHKQDADKGTPLANAAFTVAVAQDNQDVASRGLYVQADGSLGPQPYEHTTNQEGIIRLCGMDEGTYVIRETKAPEGYFALGEDVRIRISATRDEQELSITSIEATVSSDEAQVAQVLAEQGTAVVRIRDSRQPTPRNTETLAQTGVGPIAASLICLGVIVLALASKPTERSRPRRRPRLRA